MGNTRISSTIAPSHAETPQPVLSPITLTPWVGTQAIANFSMRNPGYQLATIKITYPVPSNAYTNLELDGVSNYIGSGTKAGFSKEYDISSAKTIQLTFTGVNFTITFS